MFGKKVIDPEKHTSSCRDIQYNVLSIYLQTCLIYYYIILEYIILYMNLQSYDAISSTPALGQPVVNHIVTMIQCYIYMFMIGII